MIFFNKCIKDFRKIVCTQVKKRVIQNIDDFNNFFIYLHRVNK